MLDLKYLEALVDEALANETEVTMAEWLVSQRNSNIFAYFGCGDVENIRCSAYGSFEVPAEDICVKFSNKGADAANNCVNNELALAA